MDTEHTTKQTTVETTNVTKVDNKNATNFETLIKDLISQVSELKKEISELKSNKQSNEQSSPHTTTSTILRPEDDEDLFIRERYGKYLEDTEKVLTDVVSSGMGIPSTSIEYTTKKVGENSSNIFNEIEKYVETPFDKKLSADFSIEKNTEITEKSKEYLFNNSDIFTDDLPYLEKVPAEIVLNSLLKGSIDTIKILDSFINNNHVRVVEYTENFHSIENFYIKDNQAYFLSIEQWCIVYDIISECKNLSVLKKTIKKNPYIVYFYYIC